MSGERKKSPHITPSTDQRTLPLLNKTVIVTRPRAQAVEMTKSLAELGAAVIHCPTIETVEPSSWDALDESLSKLESYDWVVFTSANGARFFLRRLSEKRAEGISLLRGPVICAIGPATARALEQSGARVDVLAIESRAEGALKAIIDKAGGEQKIAGSRVLMPRARVAREVLPVELSKLGALVDDVEAYQTIKPDVDIEALVNLLNEGRADAITFTSPSTVNNFAALVGQDDLSGLLSKVVVGCIGPTTAAAAREHELNRIVQPGTYTAQALIEAMVKAMADS